MHVRSQNAGTCFQLCARLPGLALPLHLAVLAPTASLAPHTQHVFAYAPVPTESCRHAYFCPCAVTCELSVLNSCLEQLHISSLCAQHHR